MIVVTGMHRSGTSAVAMTLEALGVDFGPHDAFYGADEWNERGYFERNDVVDLNSRILTGFPRTQGRVAPLVSQVRYLLTPSAGGVQRRARALRAEIRALANELDGIAVKDPRFCLTLDAWTEFTSAWVVCLRHPADVARSLHRRQRVPLTLGLRFWDRHAEALLELQPASSLFIDFDALTGDDTAGELGRVVDFLDLDVDLDRALEAFGSRFSPELRHFKAESTDALPRRTRELWSTLQERRRS